jgi:dTDP-4-amino-4,6-dideoxygalactose transaminase
MIQAAKMLRLFPWVLSDGEKRGISPLPHRLPNVLVAWALRQLELLPQFTRHRTMLVEYYDKALSGIPGVIRPVTLLPGASPNWFRYSIEIPNHSEAVLKKMHAQGILLGDWYRTVLAPVDCDPASVFYKSGSCPIAETATKRIINLPTSVTTSLEDARTIIAALTRAIEMN